MMLYISEHCFRWPKVELCWCAVAVPRKW